MDIIAIIAIIVATLSILLFLIYMLSISTIPFINRIKIKLRLKFSKKRSFVLENIDTVANVHILNSRKPPYGKCDEEKDVERFETYLASPMHQFMKLTKYSDIKQREN